MSGKDLEKPGEIQPLGQAKVKNRETGAQKLIHIPFGAAIGAKHIVQDDDGRGLPVWRADWKQKDADASGGLKELDLLDRCGGFLVRLSSAGEHEGAAEHCKGAETPDAALGHAWHPAAGAARSWAAWPCRARSLSTEASLVMALREPTRRAVIPSATAARIVNPERHPCF